MDRLHEVATEIKVFHCVSMIHVDENNSGLRCARIRGVSLGMFSAGKDFAHADWLQCLCGRFGRLF